MSHYIFFSSRLFYSLLFSSPLSSSLLFSSLFFSSLLFSSLLFSSFLFSSLLLCSLLFSSLFFSAFCETFAFLGSRFPRGLPRAGPPAAVQFIEFSCLFGQLCETFTFLAPIFPRGRPRAAPPGATIYRILTIVLAIMRNIRIYCAQIPARTFPRIVARACNCGAGRGPAIVSWRAPPVEGWAGPEQVLGPPRRHKL